MYDLENLVSTLISNLDDYDDNNGCFYNVTTENVGRFRVSPIDADGNATSAFLVYVSRLW